jgi:hypothetical protein
MLVLGAATDAYARPEIERYVKLTAAPDPLDLGVVPQPGVYDAPTALTLRLTANCAQEGVVLAASQFQSAQGGSIPPSRIFVKVGGTGEFVALTVPLRVVPPAGPGIYTYELQFRITTEPTDPAGAYTGALQMVTKGIEGAPDVPGPTVACTLELELHAHYELQGNKCYFHIGNVFNASESGLTMHTSGMLTMNAGMFIGLNLSAMSKITDNSFEKDAGGQLTGVIRDAMAGTTDVLGRNISNEAIDVRILLSWDVGVNYNRPQYFGDSPDGLVSRTLWWLVNNGAPGAYPLKWKIMLLPEPAQADGNYYFESEVVVAPVL